MYIQHKLDKSNVVDARCGICLEEDDCSTDNFVKWVQYAIVVKCANCES